MNSGQDTAHTKPSCCCCYHRSFSQVILLLLLYITTHRHRASSLVESRNECVDRCFFHVQACCGEDARILSRFFSYSGGFPRNMRGEAFPQRPRASSTGWAGPVERPKKTGKFFFRKIKVSSLFWLFSSEGPVRHLALFVCPFAVRRFWRGKSDARRFASGIGSLRR